MGELADFYVNAMRTREDRPRAPRAAVWSVMNEPRPRMPVGQAGLQRAQEQDFAHRAAVARREAFGDPTERSAFGRGPRNQVREAGQMVLETTGLPAMQRSGEAFRSGDPMRGAGELGMGLLGVAGTAGGLMSMAPRAMPRAPMRPSVPDPNAVTRLPANPSREIGPNGLPIREREPFRNSLRGGSDDLREAARPQSSSALALPQSVAQIGRARGAAGMARYRYAPPEAPRGTAWDFVVEPDDANPGMFSVQMQLKQNGQSVPIDAALGSASPEEAFGIYRALQETLAADAVAHNRPGYYITGSGRLRDLHERFAERAERMGLLPEGYRFIPAQGRMPARVMRDEAMLPKPPDAPKQNTPRKPPPGGFFNFGAR